MDATLFGVECETLTDSMIARNWHPIDFFCCNSKTRTTDITFFCIKRHQASTRCMKIDIKWLLSLLITPNRRKKKSHRNSQQATLQALPKLSKHSVARSTKQLTAQSSVSHQLNCAAELSYPTSKFHPKKSLNFSCNINFPRKFPFHPFAAHQTRP